MLRSLLSQHTYGVTDGVRHAFHTLPTAFTHEGVCHDGEPNCFCKGGQVCIELVHTKESGHDEQQVDDTETTKESAHDEQQVHDKETTYDLGCKGHHEEGEEPPLYLDAYKKGASNVKCISVYNKDMEIKVTDGVEKMKIKLPEGEIEIRPRYPMEPLSETMVDDVVQLKAGSIDVPAAHLHDRAEWIKEYKGENAEGGQRHLYDQIMDKLHKVVKEVVLHKDEPDSEADQVPEKKQLAGLVGQMIAELYGYYKAECDYISDVAQKICGSEDHCPEQPNCKRSAEDEEEFHTFLKAVAESMGPEHSIRKGLKEAGITDEKIDEAATNAISVGLNLASDATEQGDYESTQNAHVEVAQTHTQAMPLPCLLLTPQFLRQAASRRCKRSRNHSFF